jgi:hypothetical protein
LDFHFDLCDFLSHESSRFTCDIGNQFIDSQNLNMVRRLSLNQLSVNVDKHDDSMNIVRFRSQTFRGVQDFLDSHGIDSDLTTWALSSNAFPIVAVIADSTLVILGFYDEDSCRSNNDVIDVSIWYACQCDIIEE